MKRKVILIINFIFEGNKKEMSLKRKNDFKKDRKKIKNSEFKYENSIEYQILIQTFSSGVRLKELASVAILISRFFSEVKEPCRDEKRNFPLLIEWFHNNWEFIYPVLPFFNLRDENKEIINGERELFEMHSNTKKNNI